MGEPACSGVELTRTTGRAWVICAHRLTTKQARVVACAGLCAVRAVALAIVRPTRRVVGGGGRR